MLFNSFSFLVFLPIAVALFAACPGRWRWLWLLLASAVFYGWQAPTNLLFVAVVGGTTYGFGLAIDRAKPGALQRAALISGLLVVLGSLTAFKLYNFVVGELDILLHAHARALPRLGVTAPAGFSFYAFSAASYLVDVYMHRLAAERNPAGAMLYVAWFPKILAGPIERATGFMPQVHVGLRFDPTMLVPNLQLIVWGLFKKVVIADNLAPVVDHGFNIIAFATPVDLLFSVYFFAFQIYCDFSGYTDMAIGVSQLFGIRLMENFRRPYLACSTAEFWSQRWHISLARWFRDYLFIPLGGSRVGAVRRYLNIMLVFAVSGLWHAGLGYGVGWTFLVWGALNGLYQCIGIATADLWHWLGERLPWLRGSTLLRVGRRLLTFHLVLLAWVFFRAKAIGDAVLLLRRLATSLPALPGQIAAFPYSSDQLAGLALITVLLVCEMFDERRPVTERLARAPVALRWGTYYACIFAVLLLGHWQSRAFIYMQF